jgi:pyruvate dehydrogenase E2 component (dihydrolipoamide acetyltransferase)
MATAVIMPKQGQSVETCIITKWFKKKGETVSSGDILFSYETDKASFDLEATENGILLDIFFGDGDEVPVLVNVAVIGNNGEQTESFRPGFTKTVKPEPSPVSSASQAPSSPNDEQASATLSITEQAENIRKRISPRARKIAISKGVDYSQLSGSGPNGRIIARDIENGISSHQSGSHPNLTSIPEYTEKPLSNVRKLIAKAMHASLQNSAQLTHHMSADVRYLLEARQKIKEKLAKDRKQQDITLNDMICWCVIRALERFPEANSHFLDDRIKTFSRVHLGLAVDTPRGLMVPALKDAESMDLNKLSRELKSIAEQCKKGSINPELIQGTAASFTVSNLGNYGVEMFTPVINLPQVAILGVCTIINRPANLGNNVFGFVPYLGLSLTYDHRAIDGGPATLFLREIKEQIESFRYK